MKKVGVITFHSAENSGAVLQCIALQMALKKLGADPFVIDYQPQYVIKQYKVLVNPFEESKKNKGLNRLKSILAYSRQNIHFRRKLERKNKFQSFRDKYMVLSKRYSTIAELKEDPPEADVYIAGSDQIWNAFLTGGVLDPAFFLQFGKSDVVKTTYAISIGGKMDANLADKFLNMGRELRYFSFREKSVCESMLPFGGGNKIVQCVDPTLLIDMEDWKEFITNRPYCDSYILVYGLEKNEKFKNALNIIKQTYPNSKIVDISQINLDLGDSDIRKMGFAPDEFLNMIWHADFVLTNSFHCTVFSTIFHKEFWVVPHTRSNARIQDLLDSLRLQDHFYNNQDAVLDTSPDWESVDERIREYRAASTEYMKRILDV